MKQLKGAKLLNSIQQKTIKGSGGRSPGCMEPTLSPGEPLTMGNGNRDCFCDGVYMGKTNGLSECCILCELG